MDHVAIAFNNKLGNFIFMTSAVKILKKWGYENIDLITDVSFMKSPAFDLAIKIFSNIETSYDEFKYDRVFTAQWSVPICVQSKQRTGFDRVAHEPIYWQGQGIHEVQAYLNMVGAGWEDFDGYIFEDFISSGPELRSDRPRIALANPSGDDARLKGWPHFPELSRLLDGLGYTVILLGVKEELEGCIGLDFVGKLSLMETASVLRQCDLLVAPATGLAIVADAVGTPIICLDGPIPSTKVHPLRAPYKILRRYVSCAPCFQSLFFKECTNAVCMDGISSERVYQEIVKMLNRNLGNFNAVKLQFKPWSESYESVPDQQDWKRVGYLVACYNRYALLVRFLDSLRDSKLPAGGHIFFLNDASSDPRVGEALHSFSLEGIKTSVIDVDYASKLASERANRKMPSAAAYNRLYEEAKIEHEENPFDYFMILDPDSIMHPCWVQKSLLVADEAIKEHSSIRLISAFNNVGHPMYDSVGSEEIHSTEYGNYRLRDGVNLQFLIPTDIAKEFMFYDMEPNGMTLSADLPHNKKLAEKGYKSLILVPSMTQHLGAYDSALPRRRSNEIASDFRCVE